MNGNIGRATIKSIFILLLTGAGVLNAVAESFELTPVQVADGTFTTTTLNGVTYYQSGQFSGKPAPFMYFRAPEGIGNNGGKPVYAQVFFKDDGTGSLDCQYDSSNAGTEIQKSYWKAEASYGVAYYNYGGLYTCEFRLNYPRLLHSQNNGADLRILKPSASAVPLTIQKVVLWTAPSPFFSTPWVGAYTGPTRSDIDRNTLDGKILAGYQGWFSIPHDGSDLGYKHWSNSTTSIGPNLYHPDMWPDMREYDADERYQAMGVTLTDGTPGVLYSPFNKKTVLRHCRWMSQHGIDGVFLSRFIANMNDAKIARQRNMVLGNLREGCNLEGRVWAIMYDVSNVETSKSSLYTQITNDWKMLVDTAKIRQDARYLYQDGKPVILLWGLGFNDRPFNATEAANIINFFHNDPTYGGVYLIGGVPKTWRTYASESNPDSQTDPAWAAVYRSYDSISPWTVGRYADLNGANSYKNKYMLPDFTELNNLGKGYMPVVFPGFSWVNMNYPNPTSAPIDRQGGNFIWRQFYNAMSISDATHGGAKVKTIFVAMFDEVDEGTAIAKVSPITPVTNNWVTYGSLPTDWYLSETGAASMMLRGELPLSPTMYPPMFPKSAVDPRAWSLY